MTEDLSPVYGVRKNPTMIDYPGHLAAIFYTAGCNFRCRYCHNTELVSALEFAYSWEQVEEACDRFSAQWVDAAVVTGGEPTLAPNLAELLRRLKRRNWFVKLDTNGSRPDVIEKVLPWVDYVAMDVKCGLDEYASLTEFGDTGDIVRSIDLIKHRAADYEFRTTVVDEVHTDEEMSAIADLVQGSRRYVLQAFLPREDVPDPTLRDVPRTPPDRLDHLRDMMHGCAEDVHVSGA